MQGVAFLAGTKLHDPLLVDVFDQPLQNFPAQAGARHLAPAEENGRFDLVSLIQEPQHMIFLGLVVVLVHINAELDFLDRNRLLMFLGLAFFLLLLIQKLAVVHDAAYGRVRSGRDFY